MKTLKQYEKNWIEENETLEEYLDRFQIDEGLLSKFKELIKGGLSLYASMFKFAKEQGPEVQNFFKEKAKKKKDEKDLKNFVAGREFWDDWFKGSKWEKFWIKINPKPEESLEDDNNVINEVEQEVLNGGDGQKQSKSKKIKPKNEDQEAKDSALFSQEKFAKYKKYEGMIDIIIGGFTYMYDLAKSNNDKKALELASGYIKNALNDPSVDDKQKEHLKEAIGEVKKAGEEQKEKEGEEGKATPEQAKKDDKAIETTSKALGGDQNQIKNALSGIVTFDTNSLDAEIANINEGNENAKDIVKSFKSKYLNHSKNEKYEKIRETNRQAIRQIAASISAAFSNIKSDKGEEVDRDQLENFIKYLINEHKKFMPELKKSK